MSIRMEIIHIEIINRKKEINSMDGRDGFEAGLQFLFRRKNRINTYHHHFRGFIQLVAVIFVRISCSLFAWCLFGGASIYWLYFLLNAFCFSVDADVIFYHVL